MHCSYLAGRACYEVKDADDPLKQIEVPGDSVIRLREGGQGFVKGDDVSLEALPRTRAETSRTTFSEFFFFFFLFELTKKRL